MRQRKAVTKEMATRYQKVSTRKARAGKGPRRLCAPTGWHRNHAPKALREALWPTPPPKPARARPRVYGADLMEPLLLVGL
jgi:hypothetical protein